MSTIADMGAAPTGPPWAFVDELMKSGSKGYSALIVRSPELDAVGLGVVAAHGPRVREVAEELRLDLAEAPAIQGWIQLRIWENVLGVHKEGERKTVLVRQ
ncbi:hypothetical protein PG993_015145 [Apiospora rasikravindrae]|uniref:Uncharacterized protein n=1 Tax=Apiospora rasikravindrae TaxID=990691 RepID=A0ABR1RQW4_9PEZI